MSHLLAHEDSLAVLVDTTGGFSPVRCCQAVRRRLGRGEETALAAVLERVKVMRVFDFEGMVEAIGEVQGLLEGGGPRGDTVGCSSKMEIADSEEDDKEDGSDNEDATAATSLSGSMDVGMIIVDNITNVTSLMMAHDHVKSKSNSPTVRHAQTEAL